MVVGCEISPCIPVNSLMELGGLKHGHLCLMDLVEGTGNTRLALDHLTLESY